jgi:cell wall-associated NlpC family hydrolase
MRTASGSTSSTNQSVPWLLTAFLFAGCASTPPPAPAPQPRIESPALAPADAADDDSSGSGGASSMRNRGEQLAEFALALRGAPYRYGGATRAGFDCSGLVFFAHRQFGLSVPRTSRDQAEESTSVAPRKLKRGDLVFFKIDSNTVNHVGIYIGQHLFVHAPGAGKPVTVDSLDAEFYAETFYSAGRFWNRFPK